MKIDHHDLMRRINAETDKALNIIEEIDAQENLWKQQDKRKGHKRYEVTIGVPKLLRAFSSIFKRRKT